MAWTLLSTHATVLLTVHRDPDASIDDIADAGGISRRWAIKVVGDLLEAGILERNRRGRSYRYVLAEDRPLRHPSVSGADVGQLLRLLERDAGTWEGRGRRAHLQDLEERITETASRLSVLEERRRNLEKLLQRTVAELRRAARPL